MVDAPSAVPSLSRSRLKAGAPRAADADRRVGLKLRELRIQLGMTQQRMAKLIGVTYQQAHKYERGINRIACGRLVAIANALGVEPGYFFEDLVVPISAIRDEGDLRRVQAMRYFARLPENLQVAVASLMRTLANEGKDAAGEDRCVPRYGDFR